MLRDATVFRSLSIRGAHRRFRLKLAGVARLSSSQYAATRDTGGFTRRTTADGVAATPESGPLGGTSTEKL